MGWYTFYGAEHKRMLAKGYFSRVSVLQNYRCSVEVHCDNKAKYDIVMCLQLFEQQIIVPISQQRFQYVQPRTRNYHSSIGIQMLCER